MALTTRTNGTGVSNLISSSWFNDYKTLLTGGMPDQAVSLNQDLTLSQIAVNPLVAPTLALAASTAMGIGAYRYAVTWVAADGGESTIGTSATITTTAGNQKVNLSAIPTGVLGTITRNIYRTAVGGSVFKLLATLADNTTTTYSDTTVDGSLGVSPPTHSTFGGALILKDYTGAANVKIGADGYIQGSLAASSMTLDNALGVNGGGTGGGTVKATASLMEFLGPSGGYLTFGLSTLTTPTKLAEMKNNGNFLIAGTQFGTTSGSVSTASGQTFDAFDIAEVYETDDDYVPGTVLCPGKDNKLTRCLHDGCPFALIISVNPGLVLGTHVDDDGKPLSGISAIALSGRVNVKTAHDLQEKTFVTSDGRGAIRAMVQGESGYSLGFTLNSTSVIDHVPQVGVFIRPAYVKVP